MGRHLKILILQKFLAVKCSVDNAVMKLPLCVVYFVEAVLSAMYLKKASNMAWYQEKKSDFQMPPHI